MVCPRLTNRAFLAVVIGAMAVLSMAQSPLPKRVNYSVNVSHRIGDYIVPPGTYVISQETQDNLNLFGLYQNNLGTERIAIIRTTRIDHSRDGYPSETRVLLGIDESDDQARRVLRGWTIAGEDGWQIHSVVAKNNRVLTRVK